MSKWPSRPVWETLPVERQRGIVVTLGQMAVRQIRSSSIAEEAALDGFYVVRTSLPAELLADAATVTAYKRLCSVERAFRSLKTVDLEIRPIFHWASPRVKAHVMLCMLAYYLEFHMRAKLGPLLYDDTDKEVAAGTVQNRGYGCIDLPIFSENELWGEAVQAAKMACECGGAGSNRAPNPAPMVPL